MGDLKWGLKDTLSNLRTIVYNCALLCQGPLNRGVSNGGGFPIWTCPSFFVLFGTFPIFPISLICSEMVRGFSPFVPFLFLGLLTAPTRNSPEGVRDTIWTFPEKVGNPPVWKPPGLASPNCGFLRPLSEGRERAEYGFGEYGFKHHTQ